MFRKLFTGIFLGATAMGFAQMEAMQGDYMPMLFLNPAVSQDMHLSQSVVSKEQSVVMQDAMAMMPFASQVKGGSASPTVQKEMAKAYAKMAADTLAPLTPAQRIRYRQLSLQFFGPVALASPKNQAALGLTSSQKSKLIAMISSTSKGMAGRLKGAQSGDIAGSIASVKSAQSSTRAAQESALKSILTPSQLAKWSAMQGKKNPAAANIFAGLGM